VQNSAQQFSPQPQSQPQSQPQQPEQAPQPQQQPQEQRVISEGPPYIFDPNATYPDPNAQAWAQYYANGGTDMTGAVYFISVPGLTDKQVQQEQPSPDQQNMQGPQPQQQGQPGPVAVNQMQPNHAMAGEPGGANLEHRRSMSSTYKLNAQQNSAGFTAPSNTSPTAATFGAQQRQDAPPLSPGGQRAQTQSYFSPTPGVSGGVPGGVPHMQGVAHQAAVNNLSNGHTSPAAAPYNQFAQMNGQFGGMGLSDQQAPPTGVQQTAGLA